MDLNKGFKYYLSYRRIAAAFGFLLATIVFAIITVITFSGRVERIEANGTITKIDQVEANIYVTYSDQDGGLHENIAIGFYEDGHTVGEAITVYYAVNDFTNISNNNIPFCYILLGVTIVFFIVFIVALISGINYMKNEHEATKNNKAMEQKIVAQEGDEVHNFKMEDQQTFVFHCDFGKNAKMYITNEDNQQVYHVDQIKKTLLGPDTYEYVNDITGAKTTHTIGRPINTDGEAIVRVCRFKCDGVNMTSYLHNNMGITLDTEAKNTLQSNFVVKKHNIQIAYIKMADINLRQFTSQDEINRVAHEGWYTIYTKEEHLDDIMVVIHYILNMGALAY